VVSYKTLCKEGDKHYAVISIVGGEAFDDGELDETSLHWACTPKQGGPWEGPPPGWKTEPDSSLDAGELIVQDLNVTDLHVWQKVLSPRTTSLPALHMQSLCPPSIHNWLCKMLSQAVAVMQVACICDNI